MKRVLALILGGGRGSRLYPLTQLRAKPAVPIAGKYRLIDIPISNCINSDINKIYVLTQFNSSSLNSHISRTYQFSPLRDGYVEVMAAQQTFDREDWFQGTADAVRQYLLPIEEADVDNILILSGDHLYRMDYAKYVNEHVKNEADITISVLPCEESKASEFGLLKIDNQKNVLEFSEKPTGDDLKAMAVDTSVLGLEKEEAVKTPYIASMGIYVFKKQTLVDILKENLQHTDFGKEILPDAVGTFKVQAYLFNSYWEDIGTIGAFYDANIALIKYPKPQFSFYDLESPIFTRQRFLPPTKVLNSNIENSMLTEGCIIEKATIKNSIIGIRSLIWEGAVIESSLIMGNDFYRTFKERMKTKNAGGIPLGIGKNTHIRKAIIDKNAHIGENVKIINKDGITEGERKDIYIKDGIVIVPKNAAIMDNTII
jgi:glucose-1-phosphate adenylyltransferase